LTIRLHAAGKPASVSAGFGLCSGGCILADRAIEGWLSHDRFVAEVAASPCGNPPCPVRQVGEGVSPTLDAGANVALFYGSPLLAFSPGRLKYHNHVKNFSSSRRQRAAEVVHHLCRGKCVSQNWFSKTCFPK
jgi:hypothetical protein